MELKHGYKVTEVGVIPEEWTIQQIINGADYVDYRGKTPPKTDLGVFLVTAKNIKDGYIDYEASKEYVSEEDYGTIMQRGKPKVGDVLITTEAPLGNVAAVDDENVALAQRVIKYRAKVNICDSTYLKYYLLSRKFQQILDDHSSGSTAKGIKGSILHKLPLILPPLPEQRAIAAVLSDVDAFIALLDRLIAKKGDMKQAAMQELLTGNRRLSGFNGEWALKPLMAIGMTYSGLSGKSKADFGCGSAQYIPFLNIITNVVIDPHDLEFVRVCTSECQNQTLKGDLFFNGSSETPEEVGMCSVLLEDLPNVYLNSFCFGFRLHQGADADGLFLAYFFRSGKGRTLFYSLAQGATRYNLSKANFLKLEVPLPELEEQVAIATILSDMDADITALEQKRDKARLLKQGMMQELLTGRIRLV